ncbi:MAG: site-2 protease family protein, partial [Alphaproteobacteria bacterium]
VWVAAAGPAVNLALAFASALLLHVAAILPTGFDVWVTDNLFRSVLINVVLAVFNMLPLPPLDGGRMAVGVLPRRLALPLARLERWGLFIIVGALLILPTVGRQVGLDLDIFGWLIETPVELIIDAIALVAGLDV